MNYFIVSSENPGLLEKVSVYLQMLRITAIYRSVCTDHRTTEHIMQKKHQASSVVMAIFFAILMALDQVA